MDTDERKVAQANEPMGQADSGSGSGPHAGGVHPAAERALKLESGVREDELEAAAELGAFAGPGTVHAHRAAASTSAGNGRNPDASASERLQAASAAVDGAGRAIGWTALLFAAAALFVWPVLMGIAAGVMGYIAYSQGAVRLGVWAMTIGLMAAAAYFVLAPLAALLMS